MNIDFSSLIDVRIAIILWILGWLLKHSKISYIKSLPNDAIPIILGAVGIIISCFSAGDVTMNSLLIGLISAVFAIGIHSSGKNIFQLAEGTTVFATAETIKNNLVKSIKKVEENSNPYNSSSYFGDYSNGNSDIAADDSLGVDESIIPYDPSNSNSSVG